MSLDRFAPPETARAVDRVAQELQTGIEQWGPALEVLLPASGATVAIEHGLGRIPDGYLLLMSIGGSAAAVNVSAWTETTAFLAPSANNVRVRVMFVTLRKEIANG